MAEVLIDAVPEGVGDTTDDAVGTALSDCEALCAAVANGQRDAKGDDEIEIDRVGDNDASALFVALMLGVTERDAGTECEKDVVADKVGIGESVVLRDVRADDDVDAVVDASTVVVCVRVELWLPRGVTAAVADAVWEDATDGTTEGDCDISCVIVGRVDAGAETLIDAALLDDVVLVDDGERDATREEEGSDDAVCWIPVPEGDPEGVCEPADVAHEEAENSAV